MEASSAITSSLDQPRSNGSALRVLMVGEGRYPIYEQAFENGFASLGLDVRTYYWREAFSQERRSSTYWQEKFRIGPEVRRINRNLVDYAREIRPNFCFVYRGALIKRSTVVALSELTTVFSYNNDDPFSKDYPFYYWKSYLNAVSAYEHIFCYRESNICQYVKKGLRKDSLSILLPYFIEELDAARRRPEKTLDAVFIGHFEPDGRDSKVLEAMERGINIKVFGSNWSRSPVYERLCAYQKDVIKPAYGEEYREIIAAAYIAVVFFSKRNNDVLTRRCFEIPAIGTAMYSESSDLMRSLWPEGRLAFYFSDADFSEKLAHLLTNKNHLLAVGEAARIALFEGGHEVKNRCKQVLSIYRKKYHKNHS